jgi:hypothetical protein
MEYTTVTNLQWCDAQHTAINCIVNFEIFGLSPFTANPNDSQSYGVEIYNDCIAGKYGDIAEYVPPPVYICTAQDNKNIAMEKLANTDWVNQPDVINPNNTPHLLNQAEFISYRNTIRAIAVNPPAGNLNWATEPAAQWSQ